MHLVSNVEGRLANGLGAFDVLRATFPASTVSGAPKVRAMQAIDELEPVKRGIYAGAAGYIGFHGDMDLAIAIRTAVVKDGQIHVQAGGGSVAERAVPSRVDHEYQAALGSLTKKPWLNHHTYRMTGWATGWVCAPGDGVAAEGGGGGDATSLTPPSSAATSE
jgi:hypothetical protein